MAKSTSDNILDLTKYLEEQKLQYVLTVWWPGKEKEKDDISIYSSFTKDALKKVVDVLKSAATVKDEPKKK